MLNLPGLLIAPLIALIVLVGFLAFWVLVVICIATASAPGQNPIGPFDNTQTHYAPNDQNAGEISDNRTDYKCKYLHTQLNYLECFHKILFPFLSISCIAC